MERTSSLQQKVQRGHLGTLAFLLHCQKKEEKAQRRARKAQRRKAQREAPKVHLDTQREEHHQKAQASPELDRRAVP
jgi:hypothetical protein